MNSAAWRCFVIALTNFVFLTLFPAMSAVSQGVANAERVMIADVPPSSGRTDVDYGVTSLVQVLSHTGTVADYDTIMGDSGIAFAVPVEVRDKPVKPEPCDAGIAWPLVAFASVYGKPWMLAPRVGFIAQTVGRELTVKFVSDKDNQSGTSLRAYYTTQLAPMIDESIRRNSPMVALDEPCFILAGYERNPRDGKLCGFLTVNPGDGPNGAQPYSENILGVVALGAKREALDRRAADRQALEYAVALADDAALPSDGSRTYLTGEKAYAQWESLLRNDPREYTRNGALDGLRARRQSAIAYLQAMTLRHEPAPAKRISAAISHFQAMIPLATLDFPKPSDDAVPSQLRQELAGRVRRLAKLDRQASYELRKAIAAMAHSADR